MGGAAGWSNKIANDIVWSDWARKLRPRTCPHAHPIEGHRQYMKHLVVRYSGSECKAVLNDERSLLPSKNIFSSRVCRREKNIHLVQKERTIGVGQMELPRSF